MERRTAFQHARLTIGSCILLHFFQRQLLHYLHQSQHLPSPINTTLTFFQKVPDYHDRMIRMKTCQHYRDHVSRRCHVRIHLSFHLLTSRRDIVTTTSKRITKVRMTWRGPPTSADLAIIRLVPSPCKKME